MQVRKKISFSYPQHLVWLYNRFLNLHADEHTFPEENTNIKMFVEYNDGNSWACFVLLIWSDLLLPFGRCLLYPWDLHDIFWYEEDRISLALKCIAANVHLSLSFTFFHCSENVHSLQSEHPQSINEPLLKGTHLKPYCHFCVWYALHVCKISSTIRNG